MADNKKPAEVVASFRDGDTKEQRSTFRKIKHLTDDKSKKPLCITMEMMKELPVSMTEVIFRYLRLL